ncbi:Ivy family c-type lysozyme inhibitor [uncultured Rhodoblastus sp.]|uniref:Ivy family c-type lysozyme inhibitor n=1 Tax=uncultured Rhodoblastus sp. TaxID=543037 RepID=UPI0025E3E69E|nr:Ivy family c-type lysozyme inhibitor [uncultured Rhodoblastus sp.]
MRSALSPALAAVLLLTGISAAGAQNYPYEIAKANPAAMAAWRRIVPADYRKQAWIAALEGTAGPLERVSMRGKVFLYGKTCIPHDCGGNFAAFLIAVDGAEASGLLASQTLGVGHRYFGAPDAEARGLLERKIRE